ncbi:hypothetical protein R1flu_009235 [Riccia fluitans]|uniref:Uncharacterized protein n=1 Tax=Riccia fluitans TaxID=41844 RepID=A0ABD1Z1N8_9MARC
MQNEEEEKGLEETLPFERLALWPSSPSTSSSSSDHSNPNIVISLVADPTPMTEAALELIVKHALEITSFVELLKKQGGEGLIRELLPLDSPTLQLSNPKPQGIAGVSLFKQRSQIPSSLNTPKKGGEETQANNSSSEVAPKQFNCQASSNIMDTPPQDLEDQAPSPVPAFAPPFTRRAYSKFKGDDSDSDGEGDTANSFIKHFEAVSKANKEENDANHTRIFPSLLQKAARKWWSHVALDQNVIST